MDEQSCAGIIKQQLQSDHGQGLIRLGDSYEVDSLAARLAARIFAVVKMEHDMGWNPNLGSVEGMVESVEDDSYGGGRTMVEVPASWYGQKVKVIR